MSVSLEEKKIFLLASASNERIDWFESHIRQRINTATIYSSNDAHDAARKMHNVPPHLLLTDFELPKAPPLRLVEQTLAHRNTINTSIIISGALPTDGQFLDEMVTGRVQYLTKEKDDPEFARALIRALNYTSQHEQTEFHLRFLAPRDVLIKEGDKADFVYFVKKGQLEAFNIVDSHEVVLGLVEVGEFVGEMAYINGEPRNANVRAVTDCELIEVPMGTFEAVLYKRPSWSKALMITLAKRIKAANQTRG